MDRLVIFGADGFIGRNLVYKLASNKSRQIIAFDRFNGYRKGDQHPFELISNVKIVSGDFFNRSDIYSVLKENDTVFHLVSSTTPATSNADPLIDVDTNIRSSIELFEICVERKIKKVIYPSSGGTVYGDIESDKITELTPTQPRSPYGIGKLTIEGYLRYFKFMHKLDYIVYRIANPYGVGQNIYGKQGVIPIFMHQFLLNKPVTVFGDGEMVRDYIYISDLVNAITETFQNANKYNEYNIGSGQGKSVNEIIKTIEDIVGKKMRKQYIKTPSSYVEKSVLDNSRFIDEFNIYPEVDLTQGIKKTWEYVQGVERK